MKKIFSLNTVFFCCLQLNISPTHAQTLYGTTSNGGENNGGTIIKFMPGIDSLIVVKSFDNLAFYPSGSLVQASDKKLYGMTSYGGEFGAGTIFSFDPSSSTYTKLKDFDSSNYSFTATYGGLIQAANGKLYGMTTQGGLGYGTIFSFDPSSATYTKLKDFDGTNGSSPYGHLMQASNGKLYGMTPNGGSNSGGVIFSFDPSSLTFKKLMDFDYLDGENPLGSLMQASDRKLYGMTSTGDGWGVIFSFDLSSNSYTKLKNFGETDGIPHGSLMQASDGKLYGVTTHIGRQNNGVIFSFDPSSSTFSILHNFYTKEDSRGDLIQASDGKLYGMTSGDADVAQAIFSFDISSSAYSRLKEFNSTNGLNPGLGVAFIEVNETNNPPTVTLTTPADDTTYTAYGYTKIILNANASDANGTISEVEFYNGTTLLHTESVAPYGYIWHHVAVGNYIITAKATDNDGNVTTSDAVHISVKPDIAPTVSMTSPTNGASYRAYSNIILTADANDVDGTVKKVDFYNGSTLIFTETIAPFKRGGYRLPLGNYSITAKATDNNGRATTSQPVAISVVSNLAPVVSITSPVNNTTYVAPVTIILSADASDVDGTVRKVDFYNGNILLFTENDAPYFRSWHDVPEGNYSITAVATDNNGKTTTSAPVVVKVTDIISSGALNFDGVNDYISIANNDLLKPSSQITIEAWVKPTDMHSNRYYEIYRKEDDYEARHLFSFQEYGTILSFGLKVGGNYTELDVPISPSDYEGKWVHVAATFDGSTKKIYRNNILIGLENITGQIATTGTSPALIGSYIGQEEFFNGTIDEVRVWNRALTLAEIEHNTDCELALPQTGLIAYYKFNQGVNSGNNTGATSLTDQSGNQLNGTLNNFALTGITSNWVGGKVIGTCTVYPAAKSIGNRLQFDAASLNSKTNIKDAVRLQLVPNPAKNILNIYTTGFQKNKQLIVSIISVSGVILKTKQSTSSAQTIQLNVASLVSGVYTIKVESEDKIFYKQFVKL